MYAEFAGVVNVMFAVFAKFAPASLVPLELYTTYPGAVDFPEFVIVYVVFGFTFI